MSMWANWLQGDAVHVAVSLVLLAMSLASWCLMALKTLLLWRAGMNLRHGIAAFWQAPAWEAGARAATGFDASGLLHPLLAAADTPAAGTLAAAAGIGEEVPLELFKLRLQAGSRWRQGCRIGACWRLDGDRLRRLWRRHGGQCRSQNTVRLPSLRGFASR
jgi:hypothetical protein